MRVIIAGSRHIHDYKIVCEAMGLFGERVTEVVSGGANGVDTLGERWARERGIPVAVFPAKWHEFGRAAGPIRNGEMADYADRLVAILAPNSKGTKSMINIAKKKGLEVYIYEPKVT